MVQISNWDYPDSLPPVKPRGTSIRNSHYGQDSGKTGDFHSLQALKSPPWLARGRAWGGFEVALGSHWGRIGVALRWPWGRIGFPIGCLAVGFGVALGWLWVASTPAGQLLIYPQSGHKTNSEAAKTRRRGANPRIAIPLPFASSRLRCSTCKVVSQTPHYESRLTFHVSLLAPATVFL